MMMHSLRNSGLIMYGCISQRRVLPVIFNSLTGNHELNNHIIDRPFFIVFSQKLLLPEFD